MKRMRLALERDGYTARSGYAGKSDTPNPTVAFLGWNHNGIEDIGTKIVEQIQWIEGALERAGEHNQLALEGQSLLGESVTGVGLGLRLIGALREEIARRDHQGSVRGRRHRRT